MKIKYQFVPEYNYYLSQMDRRFGYPTYSQYLKWRTAKAISQFN